MLDDTTLERFEEASPRGGGARITDYWRPGLSDSETDELGDAHSLLIPEAARRQWRWHDGSDHQAAPRPCSLMGAATRSLVAARQSRRLA